MSWEKSNYTAAGAALLSESLSGGALVITRAVSGTGTADADLSEETGVSGETHDLKLLDIETVESNGETARRVKIQITGADETYIMHQVGVYGRLNDDAETLLFIMQDARGVEGGVLMAETFKVGANARELLRYTQRATRIVTDDISRSDARKIIQKVAALEDVRDIQKVCGTAVHALDTRDREGFSKSTFRLYGEGIRLTARQILLDAHAANNVNFQTDYDKRVEKIGAVVDGCSLLLEYLTICTEEGIISAKKAGIWTKKVTDVKYPAMKWLTSERGRAEKLRAEAERKRLTEQAAALKAVLYPEP